MVGKKTINKQFMKSVSENIENCYSGFPKNLEGGESHTYKVILIICKSSNYHTKQ